MTIKYVQYVCQGCNKLKAPMDMHNEEICKNCWLKEYKSKFKNRTTTNYRKNKALLGSGWFFASLITIDIKDVIYLSFFLTKYRLPLESYLVPNTSYPLSVRFFFSFRNSFVTNSNDSIIYNMGTIVFKYVLDIGDI